MQRERLMTIFNIVGDCRALEILIESELENPETGETREFTDEEIADFLVWVKENEENLETKFNSIYKVYRNLKAEADIAEAEKATLKAEIDRLGKRAKARVNNAGRAKGLIEYAMTVLKMKKFKSAIFSAGFQATRKTAKPIEGFFNPDKIPVEFLSRELSSSAINKAIAEGRLYEKDGTENRTKLFYKDDSGQDEQLKGVSYMGGETLVVR